MPFDQEFESIPSTFTSLSVPAIFSQSSSFLPASLRLNLGKTRSTGMLSMVTPSSHDGREDTLEPQRLLSERTSAGIPAFPWRLHDMLDDADTKAFNEIVSWQDGGRGFKVHDKSKFARDILPLYFQGQTQYTSFQRQLNIYGFERVTTGVQKGSYTHKLFVRGKPNLCRFMVRTKIKRKNGSKASFSRTESCPNTGYNRTSGMDFSHGPFSIGAPNQPFNLFQANNLAASSATAKMLGLTTSMSRYKPQVDDRRQPQAINSSKLLPSTTLFPNGSQSLTTMLGGTIRETPHGREDTADTLDLDSIFADDIQDRSITSPTNAQPDQLGIISDLMEEGYGAPMDRSERPKLNEDLADELVRMFLPGERDCTTTDYY